MNPTESSELQYELQRLLLDPDPEGQTTWIHVVRGNVYFTPDLYLQLFYQSNARIDREQPSGGFRLPLPATLRNYSGRIPERDGRVRRGVVAGQHPVPMSST